MKLCLAALAAAVAIGAPRLSPACSCAPPPPPCEALWQAGAVFTGEVTAVETPGGTRPGDRTRYTLAVSEVLHGAATATVEVDTGGMCGATLELGKRYIVYAEGAKAPYAASACSRTAPLELAGDDLAYARALPRRDKAIVEGFVALDGQPPTLQSGVEVRARGTREVATTDARGHFRLLLAPGNYTLDASAPGLRVQWDRPTEVVLPVAAACARREITMTYDGHLQGRVTDRRKQPVAGITVAAESAGPVVQRWRLDAATDADGRYDISGVPPGAYRIGVSTRDNGGPAPDRPYPTTYHPGVPSAAKAAIVRIGRSARAAGIDLVVPPPLAVHDVDIDAVRPRWHVAIDNTTYGRGTGGITDDHGHYHLREVAGSRIQIRVCTESTNVYADPPRCTEVQRTVDRDLALEVPVPP